MLKHIPRPILFWLMGVHSFLMRGKIAKCEKTLMTYKQLHLMQKQYPAHPVYGYDAESASRRGKVRAKEMMKLLRGSLNCTLELGCWDGMVSYWLWRNRQHAFAIDNRDEGFDERTKEFCIGQLGVFKMDATDLKYPDNSFDLVFSYDCMEHFAEPVTVFSEAIRVTKPGGYIYLHFGPLYNSAMGLHAYRSINVPYCQHLFDKATLDTYVKDMGLDPIDYGQLNGWTLMYFRGFLNKTNYGSVELVKYREIRDARYVDMISKYAECFVGNDIDEYLVSHIEVLFRKK